MEASDFTYLEGARRVLKGMRRFTVLQPALSLPPLQSLSRLMSALIEGNPYSAADEYHTLTYALLTGGYRRTSGNLLQDFLLYLLLEKENAFSAFAAREIWDEPLAAAMRAELSHMAPLFELHSSLLKNWLHEAYRDDLNKPRAQKDKIALLSSAVWSGGTTRPLGSPAYSNPAPAINRPSPLEEQDFLSWLYQPEAETVSYVADEAYEELCRRLLTAEDRTRLLDDLWHFHAAFGTGVFIRYRAFYLDKQASLSPVPTLPGGDAFSLYQNERELELKNVIRFMREERADNMLLTGHAGAGKTTQIFALAHELFELRLLTCPPGLYQELIEALPTLLAQPFKFLIFLDDFDESDPLWPRLRAALAPAGVQPKNILVAAAARKAEDSFFPLRIHLNVPQLKEFMELVQIMLLSRELDIDFDSIQNACIDYAAAAGKNGASPLSFRAAAHIAELLSEKEEDQ